MLLNGESEGMTPAAFGRRHGKSAQTVRNWIRAGVIPAAGPPYMIDPARADAALEAHQRANGHGGARPGAGRPPKAREEQVTPIGALTEIRRRHAEGETPADALALDYVINCTQAELEAVCCFSEEMRVTQAGLDRQKTIQEIRRRKRENDLAESRLVDAGRVRAEIADSHAVIVARLEELPGKIARAAAVWVPPETVDEVVDLVRAAGGDEDAARAVRAMLARPDGLGESVRAAAEAEVKRIREKIAGIEGMGNGE